MIDISYIYGVFSNAINIFQSDLRVIRLKRKKKHFNLTYLKMLNLFHNRKITKKSKYINISITNI